MRAVVFAIVLLIAGPRAHAMEIQHVVSKGGIEAWLVEEHAVPLIALESAFRGGSRADAQGKEGTSAMLAALLDEGAGDLDAQTFQQRLEAKAIDLSFDTDMDSFSASLSTLSENRDEAFSLLALALTRPRLDAEPVARMRGQMVSARVRLVEDPESLAGELWFAKALPGTVYGRPPRGTEHALNALSVDDLRAYAKANLTRDRLKIAVVGDIDAKTLRTLLDKTFGALPKKGATVKIADMVPQGAGETEIERHDFPQSVVVFGGPGLKRADPDFYAASVLNNIVGGGGFSARLTEEVREKRGLAYGVYTYLYPLDFAGLTMGGVATQNEKVGQSIDIIKSELARVVADGVTQQELDDTKTYMTGSYALRFDTNAKIARMLVGIQLADLGIDYVKKRNGLIEAVTLDDVKRVASRLFVPEKMLFVVVGDPAGL